jgi:drug/metabolite transporter (DMT)-like permease
MNLKSSPVPTSRLMDIAPGVIAASSFAIGNVLSKLALLDGADVLTLSVFRGVVGTVLMLLWLRLGPPRQRHTPRARLISLGLGVLFAGVVFGLFAAIARVAVPVALLSYFVYPLITGLIGALLGIERVSWRGLAAAFVAFIGLGLMIGANPEGIVLSGLAFAVMAAGCRTAILLITRSTLQEFDPQVTTWYTLASSTAVLGLVALATWNWQAPASAGGWAAMGVVSIATTIGLLALFISIKRIGPFRSALVMNLEPLFSTILSAPVLGEVITPLQAMGGAIMLIALISFQLRR